MGLFKEERIKNMAKEITTVRGGNVNPINATRKPRVALNNISVDDSNWRFTSGKSRPSGRGTWAFSIGSKEAFDDIDKAFWHYGSYSEAVREAKKEAQRRGSTRVFVMG